MEILVDRNRAKLKLLKYVFLSAGCCVLFTIIVTLYLKNIEINQNIKNEPAPETKSKVQKEYNLAIIINLFKSYKFDI